MTDLRILDRAELAAERDRLVALLARIDPDLMVTAPERMVTLAERGEWQMWVAGDFAAAATTSVRTRASGATVLTWEGCAGDAQDWPALARRIEKWGKRRGAERARLYGRKGWVRALDYTPVGVIAERGL